MDTALVKEINPKTLQDFPIQKSSWKA